MSEAILLCNHVAEGQKPDVVLMEEGNVHYAVCGPCAGQIEDAASEEAMPPMTVHCNEHASAVLELAAQFTCDGFWINHPEHGWSRQPDEAVA